MSSRNVWAATAIAVAAIIALPALTQAQFDSRGQIDAATKQLADQDAAIVRDVTEQAAAAGRAALAAQKDIEIKFKHGFPGFPFGRGDEGVSEAATEVHDAKDETAKAAALKKLTTLLDKIYEEDMQSRQRELESIQARLEKLQAQLERRRAKKQEIIDLEIKVALNEADGLGFYNKPEVGPTFNFPFAARVPTSAPFPTTPSADELNTPPTPSNNSPWSYQH